MIHIIPYIHLTIFWSHKEYIHVPILGITNIVIHIIFNDLLGIQSIDLVRKLISIFTGKGIKITICFHICTNRSRASPSERHFFIFPL